MECRLPEDKLLALRREVDCAAGLRKITLRDLQSLLGKLNFACRIMPMGRVFCRRLAGATSGVSSPRHFLRLTRDHRDDLEVWARFLRDYNGRSLVMSPVADVFDWDLYTDASGAVGFGAYCQGQWCADRWPVEWVEAGLVRNLCLLELFPIVVALEIWGDRFSNKKVRFHCDNQSVVCAINALTASSPPVVRLLRQLVLRCLSLNAWVVAVHVPGVSNVIADSLSRFQWERFWQVAPEADDRGLPCPDHLWSVVLPLRVS
ncbi:uncharacterized protein RB166_018784 [Leptodactylus fuscus]